MRGTILVERELWESAKTKADSLDLSLSKVIRWLLKLWLNGDIKLSIPINTFANYGPAGRGRTG